MLVNRNCAFKRTQNKCHLKCCKWRFLLQPGVSSVILQAQKSEKQSVQKLRLLRISLDSRLEEFPSLAEGVGQDQNGDTPPILPKPAQLTGQSQLEREREREEEMKERKGEGEWKE